MEILPLVSVIVPAYNVEQYVFQCLESLRKQTYSNVEVVIVNDGSKDRTPEIAKEYAESHQNFVFVHQENQGSGVARNTGIQHAKGDFFVFVDPDDWVDEDYVNRLVKAQQESDADLVVSGATEHHYGGDDTNTARKVLRKSQDCSYEGKESVRGVYLQFLNGGLVNGPWGKLFKASIIREHNVSFPDYRRSQDIVFNYRFYNHISSLRCIESYGYNYRVFHSKVASKVLPDYYRILNTIYSDVKKMCLSWNEKIDLTPLSNFVMIRMYGHLMGRVANNLELKTVMEDSTVIEIADTAVVRNLHVRICQILLKMKCAFLLKCFLKLVIMIKNKSL